MRLSGAGTAGRWSVREQGSRALDQRGRIADFWASHTLSKGDLRSAGFPACGFPELSSSGFHGSPGTGDWKVPKTRRLESPRYERQFGDAPDQRRAAIFVSVRFVLQEIDARAQAGSAKVQWLVLVREFSSPGWSKVGHKCSPPDNVFLLAHGMLPIYQLSLTGRLFPRDGESKTKNVESGGLGAL